MGRDLIRLMQSLFPAGGDPLGEATWRPAVDVYRTPRGWLLKFDLAGVRPEDISLSVQGNLLRLRGVRRDWAAEQGCQCYRMEISYCQFERTLELPCCTLDPARIGTEYRHGMLVVHIPTETEVER